MTKARFTEADLVAAQNAFLSVCENSIRPISQGKNGAITESRLPGAPVRDYTPPKTQPKDYEGDTDGETQDSPI